MTNKVFGSMNGLYGRQELLPQLVAISLIFNVFGCSGRTVQSDADTEKATTPTAQSKPPSASSVAMKQPVPDGKNNEASAEYHFSLAQAYVAEGNPDRAIEEFRLVLTYDPNSPLIYARLATEYVKKGMLSAAMETCKEALQRDPKFVDAHLMLAGLYSSSKENSQALAEYETVLKIDPTHEEAAVYRAQILSESGKTAEAIASLHHFLKKNPDSAMAWYYVGRTDEAQDHVKEAIVDYKKAMDLRPGFSQAALALGYLYEQKQMNPQAKTVYQDLFEDSQDLTAANRLATIYLKEEKYDQAIPYLQAIEANDADDMNVRVKLGLIQMEMKHYPEAIAIFKGILEKNPGADRIHYYLGSLYEETKQVDQAVAELKKITPESKLYGDAVLHVAYLIKQKSMDGSKSYIADAISKTPTQSSFYVFQASLEEEGKNVPGAVAILEGAVKKFPDDEKVRYYLGSLYDKQGDTDKGISQMEAILQTNPDNVDALNYIGYTWTVKGVRLGDAEKLLKKALSLRPDNGYIQDSWGWYLFTRGKVAESIVQLEKATKLKPQEATILEHLADAYLRSNLREKALAKYREAAKYAEDDEEKQKLEAKSETVHRELVQGTTVPRDRAPASATPSDSQ